MKFGKSKGKLFILLWVLRVNQFGVNFDYNIENIIKNGKMIDYELSATQMQILPIRKKPDQLL